MNTPTENISNKKMLNGGLVGDNSINDSAYSFKSPMNSVYNSYMDGSYIELYNLISHDDLFSKYPQFKKIKVFFYNTDSLPYAEARGLDSIHDNSEVIIDIYLNFKYYEKHNQQTFPLGSTESQFSKEAILLHELQHVLSAYYNRPRGISYDEAYSRVIKNRRRIATKGRIGRANDDELSYLELANKYPDRVAYNEYLKDIGEKEARQTVRLWLESQGVIYNEPISGLDNLASGGSIKSTIKSGNFELPKGHHPFMKVAKGGSSCANCKFLTSDKKHCGNTLFVKWYGADLLPTPVNRFCSDWYEPSPEYMANGGRITPNQTGKVVMPINPERWEKKRQHIEQMANSIRGLRGTITRDLKGDDEKTRLTALVVAIIDKTSERVGNEGSEDAGHLGVTGFKKRNVTILGNKVHLKYTGKSGVEHEKSFSDALIAKTLKRAIKDSPKKRVFVTKDGLSIRATQVNRYLGEYNITAKDLRGFNANRFIIEKLNKQEVPDEAKHRKILFRKALRHSAEKVGHKPLTLQKHYLMPELQTEYVSNGRVINLADFHSGGGIENDDSEKINNFVLTKNQIQDVISGKSKVGNGDAIQAANNYISKDKGAIAESKESNKYKYHEEKLLDKYISENRLYRPQSHFTDLYINGGEEQSVYFSGSNTVTKLNSSRYYLSWEDYFNSLLLHNYFFPDTAYELIGFLKRDGKLYAVVQQDAIDTEEKTDLGKVKIFMSENGFINTKNNDYYNPELGIILEDLHDENVLTKDGVLYFIDTVFYIKDKMEKGGGLNDGRAGGLLVGETDKDGGEGIVAATPDRAVTLGGGEIIVAEDSVKDKTIHEFDGKELTNCQILSEINQIGGGVAIPCDVDGNTTKKQYLYGGEITSAPNYDKLSHAKELIKTFSAKQVWRQTGWIYSSQDGKWRFEIADNDSELLIDIGALMDNLIRDDKYKYPLTDILAHPTFYSHYPESKEIIFAIFDSPHQKELFKGESYLNNDKKFVIVLILNFNKNEIIRASHEGRQRLNATGQGIILHELQHFLQQRHDFRRAKEYREVVSGVQSDIGRIRIGANSLNDDKKKEHYLKRAEHYEKNLHNISYRKYWAQFAEMEARDSQDRMFLNRYERSKNIPFYFENTTNMDLGGQIKTHVQYKSVVLETIGDRHYLRVNGKSWKLTDVQLCTLLFQLKSYDTFYTAGNYLASIPKDEYEKVTMAQGGEIPFASPEVMKIIAKAHSNITKFKREYAPNVHEIRAEIDRMIERGEIPNPDLKLENGGSIEDAKKAADDFINNLSEEQLSSIKNDFEKIKNDVILKEQVLLDELVSQKQKLIDEKKLQDAAKNYDSFSRIQKEVRNLDFKIRNQNNTILVIKNGGDTSSFADKKGIEHKGIPTFTKIKTDFISFDEETILTDSLPNYMPLIDEDVFRQKGYIFDAIRIDKDVYILATNGYKEFKPYGMSNIVPLGQGRISGDKEIAEDYEQGYVIVTLDQLALISDYYYKKAKSTIEKRAQESDIAQEERYDKLPVEKREAFLNQKYFYRSLPAAVKKKITEPDYEALSLSEKEKLYKPFARAVRKRLVSKLGEDSMWASFHGMYERFLNPNAMPLSKKDKSLVRTDQPRNVYTVWANPEVSDYWHKFRYMMDWKIKDIKVQRQFESDIRATALETSFGDSNTDSELKEKYGILVKRQNGEKIQPNEIEQIRRAWEAVNKTFGNLVGIAKDNNLKISHTGKTLVFASKAVGVYVPKMKTIAVSAKLGNNQFENIMAHEVAHLIDNLLGGTTGHRYASDDFESKAGVIGDMMRRNMNKKTESDYYNSTKECFARSMEQYFAIETFGDDAAVIFNYNELDKIRPYFLEDHYVGQEVYKNKLKPLIQQFLEENKEFFRYDVIPENNLTLPNELKQEVSMENKELITLLKRKESLEQRYERAKQKSQETYNNLGFGSGMRKTRLVSFSKEDELRDMIKDIDTKIDAIKSQKQETMETENKKFDQFWMPRQDSYKVGDTVSYKDTDGQFTLISTVVRVIPPNPDKGDPLETYEVAGAEYTADELRKVKEPISKEAQDIIRPEWEKMQEFLKGDKPQYKFPIGSTVEIIDEPRSLGNVFEVIGHENYNESYGWETRIKNIDNDSTVTMYENLLQPEEKITIKEEPALQEKTTVEYKKDLNELIDEELVKHKQDPKSKTPLNEISKLLGIYWENIVSKHPEELTEFLEMQKKLPSKVRDMAMYAANQEWNENFKSNLKTNIWKLIPEEFKEHKMPKRVEYRPDHQDKGLYNIVSDFVGYDNFRPVMMGVHFDKEGITATDANKLLFLAHAEEREEATYCITKDCLKADAVEKSKKEPPIEKRKYPNYKSIVPDNKTFVSIQTESLITYLKTIIAIKYFNPVVNEVFLTFDNETEMGFNSHFLLEGAEAMYKLGYEQIDIGYSTPNRAITMCEKGQLKNVPKFTTDFALIMPIMIGDKIDLNNGIMYFNAETECVATKGIEDKSCINPAHIEREKNQKILTKAKEVLAQVEESKAKHESEKADEKIADKLMSIDGKVWDALKIRSGSDLYEDIVKQRGYKRELDEIITGKFTYPLSQHVYDILEDENQHSLNQYLEMSGAFGEEQKQKRFEYLDSLTPEKKLYFLDSRTYRPEMEVIPEPESTPEILQARLKLVKKMLAKNPTPVLKARVKLLEKIVGKKMEGGGMPNNHYDETYRNWWSGLSINERKEFANKHLEPYEVSMLIGDKAQYTSKDRFFGLMKEVWNKENNISKKESGGKLGYQIGDEGMWHGAERIIKGFDEMGNVIISELDSTGKEIGEKIKVSIDSFEKEFAKFPKMKGGGAISPDEYHYLLSRYDMLTGKYEDEASEKKKQELEKEINEIADKLHRFERRDEYKMSGGGAIKLDSSNYMGHDKNNNFNFYKKDGIYYSWFHPYTGTSPEIITENEYLERVDKTYMQSGGKYNIGGNLADVNYIIIRKSGNTIFGESAHKIMHNRSLYKRIEDDVNDVVYNSNSTNRYFVYDIDGTLVAAGKTEKGALEYMKPNRVLIYTEDVMETGGKLGFKKLSRKIAKHYVGKKVPKKYQKQYGKRYSKEEALKVGQKTAAVIERKKGQLA